MKPAPFDYVSATTVEEALAELERDPEETKVLAGGQSLIPMLAFRLARPGRLVDINHIAGLGGITSDATTIRIGAMTRHTALEHNDIGGPVGRLLQVAASQIGHMPIRTRGTFGGSVAHSDAASEWCLVASLLDAEMTVTSARRGSRTIAAAEFFESMFMTRMDPDELLVHVTLPALDGSWLTGLVEVARRAGDFGIVTVATAVRLVDGVVRDAKIAIGGVSDVPVRSHAAETALIGATWDAAARRDAAELAAADTDPTSDAHGDAEYRRALVRALVPRALGQMAVAP